MRSRFPTSSWILWRFLPLGPVAVSLAGSSLDCHSPGSSSSWDSIFESLSLGERCDEYLGWLVQALGETPHGDASCWVSVHPPLSLGEAQRCCADAGCQAWDESHTRHRCCPPITWGDSFAWHLGAADAQDLEGKVAELQRDPLDDRTPSTCTLGIVALLGTLGKAAMARQECSLAALYLDFAIHLLDWRGVLPAISLIDHSRWERLVSSPELRSNAERLRSSQGGGGCGLAANWWRPSTALRAPLLRRASWEAEEEQQSAPEGLRLSVALLVYQVHVTAVADLATAVEAALQVKIDWTVYGPSDYGHEDQRTCICDSDSEAARNARATARNWCAFILCSSLSRPDSRAWDQLLVSLEQEDLQAARGTLLGMKRPKVHLTVAIGRLLAFLLSREWLGDVPFLAWSRTQLVSNLYGPEGQMRLDSFNSSGQLEPPWVLASKIRQLATSPRTRLFTGARYFSEVAAFQFGVQLPTLLPIAAYLQPFPSYLDHPHNQLDVLAVYCTWKTEVWHDIWSMLRFFVRESASPHALRVFPRHEAAAFAPDMASYAAAIFFPWERETQTFFELLALGVPVFAADDNFRLELD
ncbi:unnamed protein product [Polarella glacialis]|uniref:Uncharacterized protein n=1 Tax=Polarella glacialis TaxID=89957 RepID=A0A813IKV2_POLGL|nr:unnamed protein product [Polarella glacialis]